MQDCKFPEASLRSYIHVYRLEEERKKQHEVEIAEKKRREGEHKRVLDLINNNMKENMTIYCFFLHKERIC